MQEAAISPKLPRRLQLPERRNRRIAEFDRDVIEFMLDVLEIHQNVYVSWSRGDPNKPNVRGTQRWVRGTHHHIDVSFDAKHEDANRFLLHELAHAAQAERFSSVQAWNVAYSAESEVRGYEDNRYEVEARAIAEEFTDDFKLVK